MWNWSLGCLSSYFSCIEDWALCLVQLRLSREHVTWIGDACQVLRCTLHVAILEEEGHDERQKEIEQKKLVVGRRHGVLPNNYTVLFPSGRYVAAPSQYLSYSQTACRRWGVLHWNVYRWHLALVLGQEAVLPLYIHLGPTKFFFHLQWPGLKKYHTPLDI
jgi:hypothetical protein